MGVLSQQEPFYPERMANRILGMGDVLSFVEKAQDVVEVRLRAPHCISALPHTAGVSFMRLWSHATLVLPWLPSRI